MGLLSWNPKKEVLHIPIQKVHFVDCLFHQAQNEISQHINLVRVSDRPFVDEAIIFNLRHLLVCNDVNFDFMFAYVVFPPLPSLEEHKNPFFYDVA